VITFPWEKLLQNNIRPVAMQGLGTPVVLGNIRQLKKSFPTNNQRPTTYEKKAPFSIGD
jgi:hypothetical protein